MYHLQEVDEGYQIFCQTTVQEYPPEVISSPAQGEHVYASREEALKRLQELNKRVKQQLGRVVEITIQCESMANEQAIRTACTQWVEPLQEMLEFLAFTDARPAAAQETPQPGMVCFLMRLLEPLTHADADGPLRDLLSQFLQFKEVTRVSFSFQVIEVAD